MGCLCDDTTNAKETNRPPSIPRIIKPINKYEIKEDKDKVTMGSDIYHKIKDFSPKKGGFRK